MDTSHLHRRRRRPPQRPLPLLGYLFFSLALPEVVLHIATATSPQSIFNSGLFLGFGFNAVTVLVLFALIGFFGAPKFFSITSSVIALLFCSFQLVYYRIFGCFCTMYSIVNGGQAVQFWHIALSHFLKALPLILIMALPLLFYSFWGNKHLTYRAEKKWMLILPVAAAFGLQSLLIGTLPLWEGTGDVSPYGLYHHNSDAYYSIHKLGTITALRLDATRLIIGETNNGSIQLETPPVESYPHTVPEPIPEETQIPTEPPITSYPNKLDLDFVLLNETTMDPDLAEVHRYFMSRPVSHKNEKTGLFEGSNLILITAEAFSDLIVDPQRTPTLYKMMNEGFYFTNYYVPDWGTSTTDGEYAFLTGTIPKPNCWSFYESANNAMPLTMSQQLISNGYNAYAYHGHSYSYYHRDQYLENLGYRYRAYNYGLPVKKTWPESDVEVVDLSVDDFASKEPFTAYYMTISGHREFTFSGNYIANKNKKLVADEPYSSAVRAYIACQLELEKSLTLLMERLEAAGTLENTVFVLTADHYPNGLTEGQISELLGHEVGTNFEIYKNGCIIYKPGMTPEVIEEPCSHLDLLPTLSNLFGLDFDSRLYMGRDIFSEAEPLVMFRNRSWITNLAYYNAETETVLSRTEAPVSEEYVQRIHRELSNRFTVSSRILDYDYWNILFP